MYLKLKSWEEIDNYATKHNLYEKNIQWLLDIDDTLIECKTYVGSTKWFDKQWSENPGNEKTVITKWNELVPFLEFQLIDAKIHFVLNKCCGKITAVTSRNAQVKKNTIQNLIDVGLYPPIINVILCGSESKSIMVKKNVINLETTYIFIDDKEKHVLNMAACFPDMHCIWFCRETDSVDKKILK